MASALLFSALPPVGEKGVVAMSKRIVLLVTVEDMTDYVEGAGEQVPPLDPPTLDAVRAEIQANLESVWPYARVRVVDQQGRLWG